MDRIQEIKAKRDVITNYYDEQLPKMGCTPQSIAEGEIHGRYQYIFKCNRRNDLSKHLLKNDIENKIYYTPLTCDTAVYKSKVKQKLPVARRLLRKSLTIPMLENMCMDQAEFVIKTIRCSIIIYRNNFRVN